MPTLRLMDADRLTRSSGEADHAEHLLDVVFDATFRFSIPDGAITYWNPAAERAYGWPAADAIGRRPDELLQSVHGRPRDAIMRTLLRQGRWEGEITQKHRDGRRMVVESRWVLERDASGRPASVLEVNRDVTGYWSSRRQFQLIFEALRRDAIILVDGEGMVRAWNPGAENVFGWTATEMTGRRLPRGLRLEPGEHEGWLPRKGGRLWARATASAVIDAGGVTHGMALLVSDLTAQRQEEERQRAHERARAEFMNVAAHELRAPVTVVAGYLSMLAEGTLGNAGGETKRVLELVAAKVGQLSDMIEEIVEWARLEEGAIELDLRLCDLNELLVQALDSLSAVTAQQHRLELELAAEEVPVLADRRRLLLVISGLLSTLIGQRPAGGELVCRVRRSPRRAVVELRDPGVELSASEAERLFARSLSSWSRVGEGATSDGWPGLYLARWLARLHGGDVVVEAAEGGTTIMLWLPPAPVRPGRRA